MISLPSRSIYVIITYVYQCYHYLYDMVSFCKTVTMFTYVIEVIIGPVISSRLEGPISIIHLRTNMRE